MITSSGVNAGVLGGLHIGMGCLRYYVIHMRWDLELGESSVDVSMSIDWSADVSMSSDWILWSNH